MKTRERKQEDLNALTEQFKNSTAAMVLSFSGLTVDKDQAFRNELRETGSSYRVVKNTLARIAVKDTSFEKATKHFKGVTSVALTDEEPIELSKVIAKYVKEYKDIIEFKTGVIDGKVIGLDEVNAIASLPSKDELIAKLLFLLNAPAQRLATVLNAVPRDLASVVKQVSERPESEVAAKEEAPAEEAKTEEKSDDAAPEAKAEEPKAEEKMADEGVDEKKEDEKVDGAEEEKSSDDSADEKKADEESKEDSDEKSEGDSEEAK